MRRRASTTSQPPPGADSAAAAAGPQPRTGGWHLAEWASELAGTFLLLFLGFSAVVAFESPSSPLPGDVPWSGLRLVIIGLSFGLIVAAIALSPLGRRSGAHLDPAVTLGFWLRGHVHPHDLAGYTIAQLLGALAATALLRGTWGTWAARTDDAATLPTVSSLAAAGIELGLTAALVLVIFGFLSFKRTARWTPAAIVVTLPILIRIGAPYTGASMNPARTLGPAVVSGNYSALWAYLVGPLAGAACAVLALKLLAPERKTLTAKLFHDQRYPSTLKSLLPAQPAGSAVAGKGVIQSGRAGAAGKPDLVALPRRRALNGLRVYARDMDPEQARKLLSRERERIEASIRGLAPRESDEPTTDLHLADQASDVYEAELDEGLSDDLRAGLAAVERAEQRLAAGRYGLSIESGDPIADERLEAEPTAERTAEEQARFERGA